MAHGEGGGGALRELLAIFEFDVDDKELKKGESKLHEFGEKMKKLVEGIAAAFAVEAVESFVEKNVQAMTEIERTATALGITTDKVQELQFASKALGMESDELLSMMGKLQVSQQEASRGSGQQAKAFQDLGVHIHDAQGKMKGADELFLDVADGIKNTKDASKAAAIATELFGRSGRRLLPFLKEGREGAEKLAATFHEIGGGFSEDTIKQAKETELQMAKLDQVFKVIKNTILKNLLPPFTALVSGIGKMVLAFNELTKNSYIVQAALIVLGEVAAEFAIAMVVANAPLILMAAAIAALILVVDDVITMFEGGESVIGDVIDKLFGKDAHLETVKELKEIWHSVSAAIKESVDWLVEHKNQLASIAKYIPVFALIRGGAALSKTVQDKLDEVRQSSLPKALGPEDRVRQLAQEGKAAFPNLVGAGENPLLNSPLSNATLAPQMGGAVVHEGDTHIEIHPSAGMDEKQLGEHTAKVFSEHRKQERRATAATFQRAPAATGG